MVQFTKQIKVIMKTFDRAGQKKTGDPDFSSMHLQDTGSLLVGAVFLKLFLRLLI